MRAKQDSPHPGDQVLYPLNLRECNGKRLLQGVHTVHACPKQKVCRSIKRKPKEQIADIHHSPFSHIIARNTRSPRHTPIRNSLNQGLHMSLKRLQVADSVLAKHRSEQLSRSMPFIMVGREDRVAEEVMEILVKRFALAIVLKLAREYGFDVLRLGRDDAAQSNDAHFGSPSLFEETIAPVLERGVVPGGFGGPPDGIET